MRVSYWNAVSNVLEFLFGIVLWKGRLIVASLFSSLFVQDAMTLKITGRREQTCAGSHFFKEKSSQVIQKSSHPKVKSSKSQVMT
jgi:hypothetical protein